MLTDFILSSIIRVINTHSPSDAGHYSPSIAQFDLLPEDRQLRREVSSLSYFENLDHKVSHIMVKIFRTNLL